MEWKIFYRKRSFFSLSEFHGIMSGSDYIGFWKDFVVFLLLKSAIRLVWWMKNLHQHHSAMTEFWAGLFFHRWAGMRIYKFICYCLPPQHTFFYGKLSLEEIVIRHPPLPGAVTRSEACPLGMEAAPSLIPMSSTFFHGDLVMKQFLRPFSLFCWFQKSSCQLLVKECALNTGKLPRRLAQDQCG